MGLIYKKIYVVSGDLPTGEYQIDAYYQQGYLIHHGGTGLKLNLVTDFDGFDLASEEHAKSMAKAAGWAVVGGVALGPAGFVVGALLGGDRVRHINFVGRLRDGRRFIAIASQDDFKSLGKFADMSEQKREKAIANAAKDERNLSIGAWSSVIGLVCGIGFWMYTGKFESLGYMVPIALLTNVALSVIHLIIPKSA